MVKTHRVFLFMKGTKVQPQCGFSMQVVSILHVQGKYDDTRYRCKADVVTFIPLYLIILKHIVQKWIHIFHNVVILIKKYYTGVEFETANILEDQELREAVKLYTYVSIL